MSAAWLLLPIAVMLSSILVIDRPRRWCLQLGIGLLLAGMAGTFIVLYFVTTAEARERAECASRGGVPSDGECWIDGGRQ